MRKESAAGYVCGDKEMGKKSTYRRQDRFEEPRKRRAGAPPRRWPVRRGLAPIKREDLL